MELQVGMTLSGFCNGAFGRESYGEKVVEAFGDDWIVVREEGKPVFANFYSNAQMLEYVEDWTSGEPDKFMVAFGKWLETL